MSCETTTKKLDFPTPLTKDPDAILWYEMNWSRWLKTNNTIVLATWTVPTGLTKVQEQVESPYTRVKLSGGVKGNTYPITCQVTTDLSAEKDDRTFLLTISER